MARSLQNRYSLRACYSLSVVSSRSCSSISVSCVRSEAVLDTIRASRASSAPYRARAGDSETPVFSFPPPMRRGRAAAVLYACA